MLVSDSKNAGPDITKNVRRTEKSDNGFRDQSYCTYEVK